MPLVLMVEDDSDLLGVLAESLSDEGWTVLSYTSAEAALEAARSHQPVVDAVLCDLQLRPGEQGRALEAMFRADPALKNVPFVFMTGSTVDAQMPLGTHVLVKPFDIKQLVAALDRCLSKPREMWRRPPQRVAPQPQPQTVEVTDVKGKLARRR